MASDSCPYIRGRENEDHFDPRTNSISLSPSVYNRSTVTAYATACHEVGHACQYAEGYAMMKIAQRSSPRSTSRSARGSSSCSPASSSASTGCMARHRLHTQSPCCSKSSRFPSSSTQPPRLDLHAGHNGPCRRCQRSTRSPARMRPHVCCGSPDLGHRARILAAVRPRVISRSMYERCRIRLARRRRKALQL